MALETTMEKQDFYARLAEVIERPLTELETELLDMACELDAAEKRRLELDVEADARSTIKGRVPEFIPLAEVSTRAAEGSYGYWLYDRRTKTWLIGMSRGTHEHLAGLLHRILTGAGDGFFSLDTAAERYIEEHLGFFVSGAMNMYIPIKDEGCVLTDEEQVFDQLKGKLSWRGI
jgi:hypothetical protein